MVMPLCGTFHYAGIVPDSQASPDSSQWTLEDQSGAETASRIESGAWWKFWKRAPTRRDGFDRLRENRLVGLRPVGQITGGGGVLPPARESSRGAPAGRTDHRERGDSSSARPRASRNPLGGCRTRSH